MKRSVSQHRDATTSSDPWRSLKFSAAFLAASTAPTFGEVSKAVRADDASSQSLRIRDNEANDRGALAQVVPLPDGRSLDPRALTNVPVEHQEQYGQLMKSFEALKELPLPTVFVPGVEHPGDSAEAHTQLHVRELAIRYAELLAIHRDAVGKNTPSFPFLAKMTTWIREGTLVLPSRDASPRGVREALEQMWEYELSEAIAKAGKEITIPVVMDRLQENRTAWAAKNTMGSVIPHLRDADSISSSWTLSQQTLVALGITNWAVAKIERGENLSGEERALAQNSLRAMLEQPIFDLSRASRQERLGTDISQIAVWARIFALRVLEDVEPHPDIIALLPEGLRDPAKRQNLKLLLQDDIYRTVSAFKKNSAMNVGKTGSFFHTTMTFSAIAALRPEHRDALAPFYLEKVFKSGATESVWPYDPTRGLHVVETPRSSASRGLSVQYCRFLLTPSAENAEKAIAALERFYMYSGSLQANVAREGTHAGPDRIAPYYWAPGLYYAGRLCSALSESNEIMTPEDRRRLAMVSEQITTSALASFMPRHNIITHPGQATFQQIGPTFSTALTMTALRDLERTQRILAGAGGAMVATR